MPNYTLVAPTGRYRNQFIVTIKADSNDGDYMTETSIYPKESFEQWVVDALIELREEYCLPHKLTKYQGRLDIPTTDWGRCHTLEEVKVEYVDLDGKIWRVQY